MIAYSSESGQSFQLIPDVCSGRNRTLESERSDAGFSGYFTDSSPVVKFLFLSHRTSFQLKAVSVVNQPVQDGISDGWISDMVMPVFYGELAGNEGRDIAVPVFNHFEKVSSFRVGQRG